MHNAVKIVCKLIVTLGVTSQKVRRQFLGRTSTPNFLDIDRFTKLEEVSGRPLEAEFTPRLLTFTPILPIHGVDVPLSTKEKATARRFIRTPKWMTACSVTATMSRRKKETMPMKQKPQIVSTDGRQTY